MQHGQEDVLSAGPELVAEVLREFGAVRLRAHGGSMFPSIRSGDVLSVRRCSVDGISRGDVVLMLDHGRLFAHRLMDKVADADGWRLVTRGDSHWRSDPPRPASTLLGRVVAITGAGRVDAQPPPCSPLRRARGLANAVTRLLL